MNPVVLIFKMCMNKYWNTVPKICYWFASASAFCNQVKHTLVVAYQELIGSILHISWLCVLYLQYIQYVISFEAWEVFFSFKQSLKACALFRFFPFSTTRDFPTFSSDVSLGGRWWFTGSRSVTRWTADWPPPPGEAILWVYSQSAAGCSW